MTRGMCALVGGMKIEEYEEALREPTCSECGQSQDEAYIEMVESLCVFAHSNRLPLSMAWGIRVAVSRSMREGTCPNEALSRCKLWRDGAQNVVSYDDEFSLNKAEEIL